MSDDEDEYEQVDDGDIEEMPSITFVFTHHFGTDTRSINVYVCHEDAMGVAQVVADGLGSDGTVEWARLLDGENMLECEPTLVTPKAQQPEVKAPDQAPAKPDPWTVN